VNLLAWDVRGIDGSATGIGANRMQLKLKGHHNSKIPAATTKTPEKVWIFVRTRSQDLLKLILETNVVSFTVSK
jgi:hypothetical protein